MIGSSSIEIEISGSGCTPRRSRSEEERPVLPNIERSRGGLRFGKSTPSTAVSITCSSEVI
jgi:hypothetical protein